MNAGRRGSKENRIRLGERSFRRFWSAVTLLAVGLVLSISALSVLTMATVSAAAPMADVPCTACDEAADPVQYTTLVALSAKEWETGAVSGAGLTIGVPSDPVQYTFLVAGRAAEREAGAVSGAGLTIGVASDPVQYRSLVARAEAAREASVAASAARYNGLADCYSPGNLLCSAR